MNLLLNYRNEIIGGFYALSVGIVIAGTYGVWRVYTDDSALGNWYEIGLWSGRLSLIVYVMTLIPGIMRRFGVANKASVLLMTFRRQLGIMMFLLALKHWGLMRGWLVLREGLYEPMPFEIFGLGAVLLLLPLFLTSNDYAVRKLRHFWKMVHKLTYVAMFAIMLHVALQGFSIWTVVAVVLIVTQLTSYGYSRLMK